VPKRPETIEHDGRDWVEIKQAARYTRLKAVLLEQQGRGGRFDLLERDGQVFIPLRIANTIRRETASLRSIDRKTAKERRPNEEGRHLGGATGPIAAHLDRQDVLPMDSGRGGQGWLGQRKR
jgi:hypothetical protein